MRPPDSLLTKEFIALHAHRRGVPAPALFCAASSANPPTPSPEKIALSGCAAVNPNLIPSLSKTCEGGLHADTASVQQYADTNQHISKDLQTGSEPLTGAVTP